MPTYETEDGEPRYGKRLSPEELAAYLREQEGTAGPSAPAAPTARRGQAAREARATGGARAQVRPGDHGTWGAGTGPAGVPGSAAAPGHAVPARAGRRRPRSRWGLLVLGLVLLLVVPLVLAVVAVNLVVQGPLSSGSVLGASGVVYLDAGQHSAVYTSSIGGTTTDCTVTDPAGAPVALDDPDATGLPYASFTSGDAGRYTVSCPGGTEGVVVGPPLDADRVNQAAVLMVGALGTGLIGLGTTVAGGVRAARG